VTRKICYVSGTRADFGLMQSTLEAIYANKSFDLSLIVTGMHLSDQYGMTVKDIEASGLPIAARIPVDVESPTGASMAKNIGGMLSAMVDVLVSERPDIVLLLGDRGEMLAAALAAIHLSIPIAHIHGGERSGTVDEPVRHAISKLANFHFVATAQARDRLVRMGEFPEHVWVTGAPGLDGIEALAAYEKSDLLRGLNLDEKIPVALLVYHPVLQEAAVADAEIVKILDSLASRNLQVVALKPNSDAGGKQIRDVLGSRDGRGNVRVVAHFERRRFVSWMAIADMLVGNSSAGIIEAASFGTPVINIGTRQSFRERNANVIDVPAESAALGQALDLTLHQKRFEPVNIYGDGKAADRIVALLDSILLSAPLPTKRNAY
jgi:GDP/UDP-N,N'-diacetylbacillosamine 2-epimerase (hydrolysing)